MVPAKVAGKLQSRLGEAERGEHRSERAPADSASLCAMGRQVDEPTGEGPLRQLGCGGSGELRLQPSPPTNAPVEVPIFHKGPLPAGCCGGACPRGGEHVGGCHLQG